MSFWRIFQVTWKANLLLLAYCIGVFFYREEELIKNNFQVVTAVVACFSLVLGLRSIFLSYLRPHPPKLQIDTELRSDLRAHVLRLVGRQELTVILLATVNASVALSVVLNLAEITDPVSLLNVPINRSFAIGALTLAVAFEATRLCINGGLLIELTDGFLSGHYGVPRKLLNWGQKFSRNSFGAACDVALLSVGFSSFVFFLEVFPKF